MDDELLIEQFELVAEKLRVQVRFEVLDGPGGLCSLKGEHVLFVNVDLPPAEQVEVMGSALATLDTDSVFLVPEIRDALEAYRDT